MTTFGWVLVAYFAVNGLGSVALIGKRRDPLTPLAGVLLVIWYALAIAAVFAWGPR